MSYSSSSIASTHLLCTALVNHPYIYLCSASLMFLKRPSEETRVWRRSIICFVCNNNNNKKCMRWFLFIANTIFLGQQLQSNIWNSLSDETQLYKKWFYVCVGNQQRNGQQHIHFTPRHLPQIPEFEFESGHSLNCQVLHLLKLLVHGFLKFSHCIFFTGIHTHTHTHT